ncbi:LLM class flavin-dependent oxidoreductase [Granulosicoccus sp. 3-233]|uniref:LLM class flavin-dependent oxidoreductase n=1 Tax=Granulosicoccus sp. 3-233 TaxID=3417969 RepID=UPI003D335C02
MTTLSVLDLVHVREGHTPADALPEALDFARHAEKLGYKRFWVAEHHNMIGISSAATSVVIGYLAGGTSSIRVGSGGIMLPNHSPLQIAEQFGTLESLYPGRVDLGLGRAPGTDQLTAQAMRRDLHAAAERFPQDVQELQRLLDEAKPNQPIQAVPGAGLKVPLWMLGSSLFGAQLGARLGLPYAFASHFAPDALDSALATYRERFQPSEQLQTPYAVPCINVIVADTDDEARYLYTTLQQMFIGMMRGRRGLMPAPIDDIESYWNSAEKAQVSHMLSCAFVGSADTVRTGLEQFLQRTQAEELMISMPIFDRTARARSLELLAGIGI